MSEGGVTYTVKELIAMLERTLMDQMNAIAEDIKGLAVKIDTKASDVRVDAVEHRMAAAEERIGKLELIAAGAQAISTLQRWMVGLAVCLLAGGVTTLIYLATGSGGHP